MVSAVSIMCCLCDVQNSVNAALHDIVSMTQRCKQPLKDFLREIMFTPNPMLWLWLFPVRVSDLKKQSMHLVTTLWLFRLFQCLNLICSQVFSHCSLCHTVAANHMSQQWSTRLSVAKWTVPMHNHGTTLTALKETDFRFFKEPEGPKTSRKVLRRCVWLNVIAYEFI